MAKPVVPPLLFQSYLIAHRLQSHQFAFLRRLKPLIPAILFFNPEFFNPGWVQEASSVSRPRTRSESTFPSELAPAFGSLLVVTFVLLSLMTSVCKKLFY
jgi:hypothetical protein